MLRGWSPTLRPWVLFAGVAFVLCNAGLDFRPSRAVLAASRAPGWRWTLPNALSVWRAYANDDPDCARYLAYANAALGRPYQAYFIRTLDEWMKEVVAIDDPVRAVAPRSGTAPGGRRLVPYRDFMVEYPPGFFLWALPPALFAADRDGYRFLFSAWAAFQLALALAFAIAAGRRLALPVDARALIGWSTASLLLLGVMATHRYDAALSLLLCAAMFAAAAEAWTWAGAALGVAIASKGVPVVLLPLFALAPRQLAHRWRAMGGALGASLLCGLPALLLGGRGLFDVVRYHAARPPQVESTVAAALLLVRGDSLRIVDSFGSLNIEGRGAALGAAASWLLLGGALAMLYAHAWRRRGGGGRALLGWSVAALALCMVTGKVLSPQYLVWLLPLGLLASLSVAWPARWLLLAAFGLTQAVYPWAYMDLLALAPWAVALVLARNLLLLGWVSALLLGSRRAASP